MIRSVVNGCVYTQYRESAKDTSLSSLLDTFADCGDILLRDRSADNGGIKFEGPRRWDPWARTSLYNDRTVHVHRTALRTCIPDPRVW